MKKLSDIYESIWSDMQDRGTGDLRKKEDHIKDPDKWWRDIPHPGAPKYKKDELRGLDIIYKYVIDKIRNVVNEDWPEMVHIYFDDEPYWYMALEHTTPYGSNSYSIKVWPVRNGYNPILWSEMSIPDKRGIRYRLESRKLYLYPSKPDGGKIRDFYVRDVPEFKGEKGTELK